MKLQCSSNDDRRGGSGSGKTKSLTVNDRRRRVRGSTFFALDFGQLLQVYFRFVRALPLFSLGD